MISLYKLWGGKENHERSGEFIRTLLPALLLNQEKKNVTRKLKGIIHFIFPPSVGQFGKTTAIRHIVVRETGVSLHHLVLIECYAESSRTSQYYRIEELKGGPLFERPPLCWVTLVSRTAICLIAVFFSNWCRSS